MNTPITDAALIRVPNAMIRFPGSQNAEASDVYGNPFVSRRLELDRAALMDALEKVEDLTEQELPAHVWSSIITALAAARANFPTP